MVKPHVLLLPGPTQGHVIPAIELGQRLIKQGSKVTLINTEATHKVITMNWLENDGCEDLMVSIPDGLEPWEDRNEFGKLMESMEKSMPTKLEQLIETINKQDVNKVTCLIVDFWMSWSLRVAKNKGIGRVTFFPASTATQATMLSIPKLIDDGFINKNGKPRSSEMIRLTEGMPPLKPENLLWLRFIDSTRNEVHFRNHVRLIESTKITEWFICNSSIELEPAAFSLLPELLPVGPLLASNRLADQAGHFWAEDL
ncbi:putative cyanohydrin beta-glucosyltransferase [Helianthus anomalus]